VGGSTRLGHAYLLGGVVPHAVAYLLAPAKDTDKGHRFYGVDPRSSVAQGRARYGRSTYSK
jgi:hypothetical protein